MFALKYIILCLKPQPNDGILDWSKMKVFADYKLKEVKICSWFVLDRKEKM